MVGCKSKTRTDELPLPFINKPDFTPEWIEKNDPAYTAIHAIPDFSFTNQNGEAVTVVMASQVAASSSSSHVGILSPVPALPLPPVDGAGPVAGR